MTDPKPVKWQAGLSNAELTQAWRKKLPDVEPTERDLSAFALGAEVGFAHAQDLELQDWSRVHHALAKHGLHPGRTDDLLADVIDREIGKLRAALDAVRAQERERWADAMRAVMCSDVGAQTRHKLEAGQGTDTPDGRAWLAAMRMLSE